MLIGVDSCRNASRSAVHESGGTSLTTWLRGTPQISLCRSVLLLFHHFSLLLEPHIEP